MTPEQRAEARRLVDAATPAPWKTEYSIIDGWLLMDAENYGLLSCDDVPVVGREQDAHFIAASRALVPQLLDALEAAERERDEARSITAETWAVARTITYWQVPLMAMEVERDTARAQVATLTEALRFYADDPSEVDWTDDYGSRARAALKAAGVEQ